MATLAPPLLAASTSASRLESGDSPSLRAAAARAGSTTRSPARRTRIGPSGTPHLRRRQLAHGQPDQHPEAALGPAAGLHLAALRRHALVEAAQPGAGTVIRSAAQAVIQDLEPGPGALPA